MSLFINSTANHHEISTRESYHSDSRCEENRENTSNVQTLPVQYWNSTYLPEGWTNKTTHLNFTPKRKDCALQRLWDCISSFTRREKIEYLHHTYPKLSLSPPLFFKSYVESLLFACSVQRFSFAIWCIEFLRKLSYAISQFFPTATRNISKTRQNKIFFKKKKLNLLLETLLAKSGAVSKKGRIRWYSHDRRRLEED